MAADSHSKTEQPSARRLIKARLQGNFPTSRELVAATQFGVFIVIAFAWFPGWLSAMKEMMRASLVQAFHANLSVATVPGIASTLLKRAFIPLSIAGGLTVILTLSVHLFVTNFGFSLNKLTPDFGRFNPLGKIKNMAFQGPAAVLQASAMLVLFSMVIVSIARQNADLLLTLPFMSLDTGLLKVGASIKDVLWKAAGLFLVFGLIDLFRQKRKFTKDLRMTKQEVKEEAKDTDGNPHVKGKIRRLQRDLARRRMMHNVATATAVIVNPTHYAIALRYDHETMATPMVVAKGKNYLALRIRQRALEHNIPLVENPPLAQALYKSVDVGREIPAHLYRAVAEVLAYIYRLTRARK
ncbi:MAG: Type secretion exporter [Bryobacterales bacterium]|nr:Type secretion exporter [Bryobacterales bacterium]